MSMEVSVNQYWMMINEKHAAYTYYLKDNLYRPDMI